jgi:pyruvate dehydrogenase E2 component (dihydrolipoamide acetyltransferase)
MRYLFHFPDIGEGITEGKILEWYVQKGQTVKASQVVVKMETDKVVADIPTPKAGVIVALFGKVGDIVRVEDPLIELEIEGERLSSQAPAENKPAVTLEPIEEKGFGVVGTIEVAKADAFLPASDEGQATPTPESHHRPGRAKALATPVARAMAKDMGLNINDIPGSGPGGRVMKNDIQAFFEKQRQGIGQPAVSSVPAQPSTQATAASDQPYEIRDLSQIRKAIARKMAESKYTAPHMTALEEAEVSTLMEIVSAQKTRFAERNLKLTYLPFIIKAVVMGLKRFKTLNAQLDLDKGQVIYKYFYNIGIAVDAPDGLVVPVLHNAERASIADLAGRLTEIGLKARERQLTLADLKNGTFTISNFGAIAGLHGVPIINYPEVAILGIGRIKATPVVKNGAIVPGHILPLSLSVDHRIIDGGEASRFLKFMVEMLSNPLDLLME